MNNKFWQTWWFWTIISVVTIGIIITIVLLTFNWGNGSNKPTLPNQTEVNSYREIDIDKNINEEIESKNETIKIDANINGVITNTFFDENGNMIENSSVILNYDTRVQYLALWDSELSINFESEEEQFNYNLKIGLLEEEIVSGGGLFDSYHKQTNALIKDYELSITDIINEEKIEDDKTSIEIYKFTFKGEDESWKETTKNYSYTDYIDDRNNYKIKANYNDSTGIDVDEYRDFDYIFTYYMN